ncbi:hypothetical protein WJX81_008010 [Elliptochloris bilobata]|uniref:Uncharacterized protein n=1 Tax=Elliptochloris bilobata TaxID=381761 RepID=A0AAW1SL85_9CHLO
MGPSLGTPNWTGLRSAEQRAALGAATPAPAPAAGTRSTGDGMANTAAEAKGHEAGHWNGGRAKSRREADQADRRSLLRKASLQPVTPEDASKALDAIIVAIGIVAVLIVDVCYVGYVTTPGGPDPYWSDCHYPAFIAYVCLNGFALVFATAAIVSVTFGPLVPRTLSPEVVKPNNATFGSAPPESVTCQDYSNIANFSRVAHEYPKHFVSSWGAPFTGGEAQDAAHNAVTAPCLALLSDFIFANQSLGNDTYRDNSLGQQVIKPNAMWPLGLAHYMPALQYQCSALVNGTLCDFKAKPPLAVDVNGRYLKRKQSADQGEFIVKVPINPQTTLIYAAVIAMVGILAFNLP